ncbi:MAG: efflux RND transporter periplasmic adaptor subunit [Rhodobacteraceae bacterium]|nr:MAG: efflux RND transporter periplasmic adaptor subunit [Paracoccaceae bacterium]
MPDQTDSIARTLGLDGAARPRRSWAWLLGLGLLLTLGIAYVIGGPATRGAAHYLTDEARSGSLTVTVTATGTVEPTNLVEISSELSGTLASVEVDFNDEVDVGTPLARLDVTQLEAQVEIARAALDVAVASVARAEATLQDARAKFDIALDLDRRGITSHQSFLTARATFDRARADLQAALADRRLARAQLDLHQGDLDKACICSPIRGVVLDRAVDPGQIIAATLSAPVLFTIAEDLRQMELRVDIDEADIGRVKPGDPASFTVDAYDDRRFPARITEVRFAPQTIEGVVTYKAILGIDNADLALRPGMTATAEIAVARIEDALLVPNAALRFSPPVEAEDANDRSGLLGMLIPTRQPDRQGGDMRTLWVLRGGQPSEIEVRVGETDGRHTRIREGALAPGDRVIVGIADG